MDIPEGLILVMGISAAVTVVNGVVSKVKYGETTPPNEPPTKEVPSDQIRKKLPGFRTMLMENDKITLPRFQMFAWTWIGIIAYLGLLFWEVDIKFGQFRKSSYSWFTYSVCIFDGTKSSNLYNSEIGQTKCILNK